MSDLNGELLTLLATASGERKMAALRVLRGESSEDRGQKSEVGGPEPYLTLREVGRRLGVSPCSLWRWNVPGHELGGRRRFRVSEVAEYLEGDVLEQHAQALKAERKSEAGGRKSEDRGRNTGNRG